MRVKDLLDTWQAASSGGEKTQAYSIHLSRYEAAKIAALAEMYPGRTPTGIIEDLLSAALSELEATMPYIPGKTVISEDEHGDPVYEDAGPTPRFKALTHKHLARQG